MLPQSTDCARLVFGILGHLPVDRFIFPGHEHFGGDTGNLLPLFQLARPRRRRYQDEAANDENELRFTRQRLHPLMGSMG